MLYVIGPCHALSNTLLHIATYMKGGHCPLWLTSSQCFLCMSAGGLPVPGLEPEGPHNPFTYSVLGTAVVHLLGQSVVFGATAVLYDVGLMQLMRSAWQWVSCHTSGAAQQQPVRQQRGLGAEGDLCDQQNGGSENQQHLQQQSCGPLTAINEGQWSTAGRSGVGMSQVNRISEVSSHVLLSAEDDDVAAERVAVQAGVGLNDAMVRTCVQVLMQHCLSKLSNN